MVDILNDIRNEIWKKGTGSKYHTSLFQCTTLLISVDDTRLHGDTTGYGSYHSLANLTVHIDGISKVTGYNRSLDLSNGIHTTTYSTAKGAYTTSVYCPSRCPMFRSGLTSLWNRDLCTIPPAGPRSPDCVVSRKRGLHVGCCMTLSRRAPFQVLVMMRRAVFGLAPQAAKP